MNEEKRLFLDRNELSVGTVNAIRKGGVEDVDGERGYTVSFDTFSEISKELHFLEGDMTEEDVIYSVYILEIFAGKFYDRREHEEPVKIVEIDGEKKLFLLEGVFEETYGENDVERALSASAVALKSYPFSDWIRGKIEQLDLDVREEFLENVDEELCEQFLDGSEASKVSGEIVPDCLLGDGRTLLEISMDGCAPCKVVKSAFEELGDELEGVDFVVKDMHDEEISGFVESFGIFAAPTILFSDGERLLVHVGGSDNVPSQVEFLRCVIDGIGEFQYDPLLDKGVLDVGEEKEMVLDMKVIE